MRLFLFFLMVLFHSSNLIAQDSLLLSKHYYNVNSENQYKEVQRFTYSYDAEKNLISKCDFFLSSSGLQVDTVGIQYYSYNDNGLLGSTVSASKSLSTGLWSTTPRTVINTYDGNQLLIADTTYFFNTVANAYLANLYSSYVYNDFQNLKTKTVFNYISQIQSWYTPSKNEYFYDENQRLDSTISYNWNGITLVPKFKISRIYGNNEPYLITEDMDFGTSPINIFRDSIVFNQLGDEYFRFTQKYVPATTSWSDYTRTFTTNLSNDKPLLQLTEFLIPSGEWVNQQKIDYVYGLSTGTKNLSKSDFSVFPSPANDVLFIEKATFEDFEINVLDSFGRILLSKKNEYSKSQLDVSNLPSGVYMIRVSDKASNTVKRFIKN